MVKKTKLLGKIISCISGIALAITCVGSDIYSEEYGVDISRYQGDIDWDKFSESGMSFAILRTGTTKYGEDSRFEEYYAGTRKIGIKTGAYLYISALTLEEFRSAAYTFIDYLVFVSKRYECIMAIIGFLMITFAIFKGGNKIDICL